MSVAVAAAVPVEVVVALSIEVAATLPDKIAFKAAMLSQDA